MEEWCALLVTSCHPPASQSEGAPSHWRPQSGSFSRLREKGDRTRRLAERALSGSFGQSVSKQAVEEGCILRDGGQGCVGSASAAPPSSGLRPPSPIKGEGPEHRPLGSIAFSLDGRRCPLAVGRTSPLGIVRTERDKRGRMRVGQPAQNLPGRECTYSSGPRNAPNLNPGVACILRAYTHILDQLIPVDSSGCILPPSAPGERRS